MKKGLAGLLAAGKPVGQPIDKEPAHQPVQLPYQIVFVLGHIGRFNQQKNHPYLIEIFEEVLRRQPLARLLLLGDGPERPAIEKLAAPLGDRVIFAGVQSNTRAYYSAMDAFLLPSLFEGLPVVLAEAQSAGLPCFVSDRVDRGADLGCGMRFLPLGTPSAWADALLEKPLDRCPDALEKVRNAGYDIRAAQPV